VEVSAPAGPRPATAPADGAAPGSLPRGTGGFGGFLVRWFSCLVVAAVLVPVAYFQPWKTYLSQGPIRSDGLGYHVWTRAILDGNLDFCRFPELGSSLVRIPRPTHADPERVVCQDRYPPGLALLQLPVMAPLADRSNGAPLVSGAQHEASVWMAALALLLACMLVVLCAQVLGLRPWPTHFAVLSLVFGTGLFFYSSFSGSYTHVYTALGVALLMWLGLRARRGRPARFHFAALVAISFFLVQFRNLNAFMLAVLLGGYLLWDDAGHRTEPPRRRVRRAAITALPVAIGVVIATAFQVAINHHFSGHYTLSSYSDIKFVFDDPKQLPIIASYSKGIFTYYPVLAVVLAAGFWARGTRIVTAWFAVLVGVFVVIYGFWPYWDLGAGFGHRGFVDFVPFGMLVFAAALSELPRRAALLVGAIAVLATLVAVELMLDMWQLTFPDYRVTESQYWAHLLGHDSLWQRALRRL
jgi:hypothetical protein